MPVLSRSLSRALIPSALVFVLIAPGAAQTLLTERPTEYQVKAAYLYNFAKFVEWPAASLSTRSGMTLCVLGEDPFGPDLEETIHSRTVNGRTLAIRRFADLSEVPSCHILFVSSSETGRLSTVFTALKGTSVLTVGEGEDFAKAGGIIGFVRDGNRVRFDIDINAAEGARLKISSQLLKMARLRLRRHAD